MPELRVLLLRPRLLVAVALAWLGFCSVAVAESPTLTAQTVVPAPGSIPELARALKYDANLIFEYVYTNIDYSPTFGLKKDALGTLLDGSGNDLDQAALLVALLRASGYTAKYAFGLMRLNLIEIENFYGVSTATSCPLLRLFIAGGIPASTAGCNVPYGGIDTPHVWVVASGGPLGATTYKLDPSFKKYRRSSGLVSSLGSILGYNQSAFLSAAQSGATFVPGISIQNLNYGNISSALKTYAGNLVNHIRSAAAPLTTRDVIGGTYIEPLAQPFSLPTSYPHLAPDTEPTVLDEVPNFYRTTVQIQLGSIDKTYYADDIYGHRLSIVYNGSAQPTLYLDATAQGTAGAGDQVLSFNLGFPFCFEGTAPPTVMCANPALTNVFAFQNTLKATAGYTYAIVAGWDVTGRGMLDFHRRQLEVNRAAGNADGSEPVLGEALNMIGYAWLAQESATRAVIGQLTETKMLRHAAVGVVAQVEGPYIDMPGVFSGIASMTSDTSRRDSAFFAETGAASALEWAALEQNLAGSGAGAVSTVKLLEMANGQGDVIYETTSANWTSVQTLLVGYTANDLARITANVNAGHRVMLPRHGNLTQGVWTGTGYISIGPPASDGLHNLAYLISSNLKGGYTTEPVFPDLTVQDVSLAGASDRAASAKIQL